MRRPSRETIERAGFVLGLAFLTFLYGYLARASGWFPSHLLATVGEQLRDVEEAVSVDPPSLYPRAYDREGTSIHDSAAMDRGLVLIPSVWKDFGWEPGLKLIDRHGRVVHQWRVDPAEIFPDEFARPLVGLMDFAAPKNSYLFPDGDVVVVIDQVGTARLDACGRTVWRVTGNHHHSLTRAADGTFWVSGRTSPARRPDPFLRKSSVRHDLLVHLSEDGEVLEEISVFDILEENEALARRHFRMRTADTHLNDVEALPPAMEEEYPLFEAGDLLVSLKLLNVVFVVDPETLQVEWWVGRPFVRQHDPDFVGDGWIGVFDNNVDGTDRGRRFGGSRVVAFRPHTDSTAVWFESSKAGRLYTPTRGNWQRLGNGNLLMTESNEGRVLEVDPDGRLLWEWIQQPYDESQVPGVPRAERYDLSREEVAAWSCSPDGGGERQARAR